MLDSLSDKSKHIAIGAALGVFFTLSTTAIVLAAKGSTSKTSRHHDTHASANARRRSSIGDSLSRMISLPKTEQENLIRDGVAGLIGNTPMVRIKSLSDATGCDILAKAEVNCYALCMHCSGAWVKLVVAPYEADG